MKNYIFTRSSSLLSIDGNNFEDFKIISNTYQNIDWVFPIDEDGTFVIEDKKYDVKAGDLVYVLYPIKSSPKYRRDVAIVSNKELYDYYIAYNKYEEDQSCCNSCLKCSCSTTYDIEESNETI